MRAGKFITIEGGEGVGKSTQIAAVHAIVKSAGFDAVMTREPGGTRRGEQIRELLLTPTDEPMPAECELLLMFAARSAHLENLIRPALHQGTWVICDRFTDATYAYQGAGRHMPRDRIAALEQMVQGNLRPDLTLLLDAPIEVAAARAKERNTRRGQEVEDRFEREQTDFFRRVRDGYLAIARAEPERVTLIDASQGVASVRELVEDRIRAFIRRVQSE